MSRLSIEIPEHQHQQIKAMAAMGGMSIKDYILTKTLPSAAEEEPYSEEEIKALAQMETFFASRIAAARRGEFSTLTMDEIIAKARAIRNAKL